MYIKIGTQNEETFGWIFKRASSGKFAKRHRKFKNLPGPTAPQHRIPVYIPDQV